GRFAEPDWTPIRYLNRSFNRNVLAGYHRSSRIGLVTPLRDGMNLVAKEYVAAQNPEDPGVLVLSQFAGAAQELDSALIVNPFDTDGVAGAIEQALSMRVGEGKGGGGGGDGAGAFDALGRAQGALGGDDGPAAPPGHHRLA